MKIRLADVIINITAMHDDVYRLCQAYAVDENLTATFNVQTTASDIEFERRQSALTYELESAHEAKSNEARSFSDGYLETLAVYRKIAEALLDCDTFLFHGSAVAIDGKGYILAAPSGTGKSTLAKNLVKVLGDRIEYINDDKPLIHIGGAGEGAGVIGSAGDTADGRATSAVTVYGTPWDGKHHLSSNKSARLEGIYIIERSEEPWIEEIGSETGVDGKSSDAASTIQDLLQQTYRPDDAVLLAKTLALLDATCKSVKLFRLGTTLDDRTARMVAECLERSAEPGGKTQISTGIEEELERAGWIAYTNVGSSMMPLIEQGKDLMIIEKRARELREGDVVLFKRPGGQLVLHRIRKIHNGADGVAPTYDLLGDNQLGVERGVRDEQIIGILTSVKKNAGTADECDMDPCDDKYMKELASRQKFLLLKRIKNHFAR